MSTRKSPPAEARGNATPPRPGVCPACWGYSFHRDGCVYDNGKLRKTKP